MWRSGRRFLCTLTASAFVFSVSSCGGKDGPTPPVADPECVTPTVTDFRDSTVARVVVKNYAFLPASITIKAGQSVKWKQCGPELDPHTATSDPGAAEAFDGDLGPKAVFTKVFTVAGSNPYHCSPHPEMTGTVTVVP